jgi:hypothetical protein
MMKRHLGKKDRDEQTWDGGRVFSVSAIGAEYL